MGCVLQGGLGQAPARQAALLAGTCAMSTVYFGKGQLFVYILGKYQLFVYNMEAGHGPRA